MEIQSSGLFTSNVDLFTKIEWEFIYTKDAYEERKATHALHFLIAYGNDITQYVGKLKQKNPERLTQVDPLNKNWTPLHIAAMKSNAAVAEILLSTCKNAKEKQKMIHITDAIGWTPLHYAALTSDSLFKLFLKLGGSPKMKINKGMDSNELRIISGRVIDIRSNQTLFIEDPDSKEQILASKASDVLKEKIFGKGFFFTDSPLFAPSKFCEIFEKNNQYTILDKIFIPFYERSKANPPSLIIGKCHDLFLGSLECRAKEKIPAGSYISEYSGKKEDTSKNIRFIDNFSETHIQNTEYKLESINALHLGNESRFFNCGFPNSIPIAFKPIDGIQRAILVSLSDIDANEPVLWNYGANTHHIVFGNQVLLGKEKMVTFFQDNLQKIVINLIKAKINENKDFEHSVKSVVERQQTLTPIEYVLEHPTALLYLHFKKVADYRFFNECLEKGLLTNWQVTNQNHDVYLGLVFETLNNLEALPCYKKGIKDAIDTWVLQKIEKVSVINILKGLDLLNEKSSIETLQDLEAILREIDLFLTTYSWMEDLENYPFNLERMATNMVLWYKDISDDFVSRIKDSLENLDKNGEAFKLNQLILEKLTK